MDKRVLKAITVFTGILTLVAGVCLWFFPELHHREMLLAQKKKQTLSQQVSLVSANPQKIVKPETGLKGQLEIGLPEQVKEKDLSIEQEYLNQKILIRFPGGQQDYFDHYGIRGSSDHICGLSYYLEGENGVVMLEMDGVYELKTRYRKGFLQLTFLEPHEVYDKVIVIDAGHGSRAPGAVKQGTSEKDIDLAIVLELKKLFDECPDNIGVYYTRTTDINPTLEQRVRLANLTKADLFLSIHNNSDASGGFTKVSGTEVMYSASDTSEYSGKRLAEICLKNVVKYFGSKNRGLLRGDSIYIIRESQVPAALIEVGFMTNREELDKLKDQNYQKKAAKGIYQAVMEAFEEGY